MIAEKFNKSLDAQSYDSHAESYGKYIATLSAPLAAKICELAEIRVGQEVLDVASGSGVASHVASKVVGTTGRVVGIDFSDGMVRTSSSLHSTVLNLSFQQMDAEHLEFPDNSFDTIISLCAIAHFPNVDAAIEEMFRVVRPGGHVVVSYGSGHPLSPLALLQHKLKRVLQVFKQRCLFAPAFLCKNSAMDTKTAC
jgi:ubiquinone/menaquinone biosynthesis C-methylase UbiE